MPISHTTAACHLVSTLLCRSHHIGLLPAAKA